MKKLILLTLLSLCLTTTAFAEGDDSINMFPGIIGTSCGPGWKVNSQYTWVGITTRSFTNATSSTSFSVTSGTSGCAKHNFSNEYELNGVTYAQYNYDAILENIAVGDGEHLRVFAKSYGCSDEAFAEFSNVARRNFSNIAPATDKQPVTLYRNLKALIKKNNYLAGHCQVII